MYRVIVPPKVIKQLSRMDRRYLESIGNAIDNLQKEPLSGKKLEPPFTHLRSLRVGPYRIIYQVVKDKLVIYVVSVAHRKKVYRKDLE